MQKPILFTALAAVLPFPAALLAETSLDDRLEEAERRIKYLEQHIQEQESTGHDKAAGKRWFDRLELAGLIEIEAGWIDPDNGNKESDLVLATAELGIAAEIAPSVAGEIVLLYEDDGEEDLDVDVAVLSFTPDDSWSFTAGQYYLPFGVFETGMISDPLTLELGETRETALQAGFSRGGFGLSAYVFDGDASESTESKIDNFGLELALTREYESSSFSANLGYINDIGDSDGLIDYAGTVHDRVAGAAASLLFSSGPYTLIGEYLSALDRFATGEEPSAYNLEAGYGFDLGGREAGVAIGFQGTDDAAGVGLPEEAIVGAFSIGVMEHVGFAVEYARLEAYGGENADLVTLQLAAEF